MESDFKAAKYFQKKSHKKNTLQFEQFENDLYNKNINNLNTDRKQRLFSYNEPHYQ